jgi:broad specificity phosphatase PhoE
MRHGETEANRLGIVQGQNATPLNEVGIQQAKTSAQALARTPFSHIFCSDLVRTRQTVEPLVALCAQHTVTYDARLREKGAGTAEGLKLTAFHKMQRDSGQNVRVYKPEGGESWDDVRSRAGSFYEHLLQMMRQGVEGPVLVVSHGGARIFIVCPTLFKQGSSWRWSTRWSPTFLLPTAPQTCPSLSCSYLSRYCNIAHRYLAFTV